ncbi:MAG: hypothetical protein JWM25_1716 [Thermoleophilia bacterium]|nr:hypothetical protein [Thermoleophilia bacterium]MCZ4497131.1 hypothetical protein [Thermoleophilia bacterium]
MHCACRPSTTLGTMKRTSTQIILGILLLAACVAGGFLATNAFQKTVPIVPGLQGCWRLDGSARQVACLSEEFRSGAEESAGDTTGRERDTAVIAYVRRAEKLAAGDSRLAGTCHPAMHQLGRDEGSRAAAEERVPTYPGGSTQLCTAGYTHGLSEGYLEDTPDADVAAVFPKLCHETASRGGCAHGIGHALLRAQPGGSVDSSTAALDRCGALPDAWPSDCLDGVYMELAMRTRPEPVPVADYAKVCGAAADVDRELSCWGYLGLSLTSNDVATEDVPGWCAKASVPGQFPCIEGYGRDIGAKEVSRCGERGIGRAALQQRCIDGAIGLQVGSGHVSDDEASSACDDLDAAALVKYCRSAVERYAAGRAGTASAVA